MYMRGLLIFMPCAALLGTRTDSAFAVGFMEDDGPCSASTWIPRMSIDASRRTGWSREVIVERLVPW